MGGLPGFCPGRGTPPHVYIFRKNHWSLVAQIWVPSVASSGRPPGSQATATAARIRRSGRVPEPSGAEGPSSCKHIPDFSPSTRRPDPTSQCCLQRKATGIPAAALCGRKSLGRRAAPAVSGVFDLAESRVAQALSDTFLGHSPSAVTSPARLTPSMLPSAAPSIGLGRTPGPVIFAKSPR